MAATSEPLQRGMIAPDFRLPGVEGRSWSYAEAAGPQGLVVMFICNHCPYVLAVVDRIVQEARALRQIGVGVVAICANDAAAYPQDSFERMKAFAAEHGFDFPYLHDETQQVALAYGAVCTPDIFGFNRERSLQYRGRLDSAGRQPPAPDTRRELYEAMESIARTGQGPEAQHASMGCSIKWKAA
ncbi:thioredoxin family protein [Ideonella sp. YS5]|uniref:thioredoxin family protein n=1 Tax=Ideonella sp. YS5 TaxID=3453714 RepID=UPI003EE8B38D